MNVHPLFIDQVMVLISAAIMESFNTDEQGIIGGFLNTLGTLIEFNASYLQYMAPGNDTNTQDNQNDDSEKDNYETLQKGIEKIEEELKKIKESHQDV